MDQASALAQRTFDQQGLPEQAQAVGVLMSSMAASKTPEVAAPAPLSSSAPRPAESVRTGFWLATFVIGAIGLLGGMFALTAYLAGLTSGAEPSARDAQNAAMAAARMGMVISEPRGHDQGHRVVDLHRVKVFGDAAMLAINQRAPIHHADRQGDMPPQAPAR